MALWRLLTYCDMNTHHRYMTPLFFVSTCALAHIPQCIHPCLVFFRDRFIVIRTHRYASLMYRIASMSVFTCVSLMKLRSTVFYVQAPRIISEDQERISQAVPRFSHDAPSFATQRSIERNGKSRITTLLILDARISDL